MMHKRYKHLFFDLDHTLWDFETNSRDTLCSLFAQHEMKDKLMCDSEVFYQRYIEVNNRKWELYRKGKITKDELRAQRFYETFQSFGLDDKNLSTSFEAQYLNSCPHRTALLPGSIDLLRYLKQHYNLHIITNGFAETQQIKISKSGLSEYFQNVFSSEIVGVNKPHAGIFVESLQAVGAHRKESLMIGDNLAVDITGARNCGIDQVYYNPSRKQHDQKPTFEVAELFEMKSFL